MKDSSEKLSGLDREIEVQDHSASEYVNTRYQGYGLKYHTHVIKSMLDPDIRMGMKILDVGCGTGIIHDIYPKHGVVGIDVSDGMLKHHKGLAWNAPIENIPFKDNYYDLVICRSTLHHLPDAVAGLREMKRVLKPGGKLILWETNQSWLAEKVREATQHGDRFSHFHHSFDNLPSTVGAHFKVTEVKYEGYLAYPLFGFPDIRNFTKFLGFNWLFNTLVELDELISTIPLIRKMGFAVRVKAVK